MQRVVRKVPVADHVLDFVLDLVRYTRPGNPESPAWVKDLVDWGAGPRASQYLLLGAKALAVIQGKPSPTVADVKRIAPLVLQHRVILNYAGIAEGITTAQVVERLLQSIREQSYTNG